MTHTIPRPEHPRPQLVRDEWLSLNGEWQFEVDQADSGMERGLVERPLTKKIVVPFAPESAASGVENTDFLEAVWYRRDIDVPEHWAHTRVLLHFGAVDHDTTVWVNGAEVGRHRGGFSSFSFDITDALAGQSSGVLVVRARDLRSSVQARGKQATWFENSHCNYTRTTGIWQTVWLEAVPVLHIRRLRVTPQLASSSFDVEVILSGNPTGHRVVLSLSDASGEVAVERVRADLDLAPTVRISIPEERIRQWSPEDPHLYDLQVQLVAEDGSTVDSVASYAGLRSVSIEGHIVKLNGAPVFQRLVLDQGYWPETLMTAPTDQALIEDIRLSMAAGFNGARLHQKVFEERFFYHADRLGYLVWAEFGDWGVSGQGVAGNNQKPTTSFVTEWLEVLERDRNHPSIIGWCPLNETHQLMHDRITALDDVTTGMFLATKLADPSRPTIDASGYSHRVLLTDIYDSHSYEQDPELFALEQGGLADGHPFVNQNANGPFSLPYQGQPYFVSEYGGIWWNPDHIDADGADRTDSWGYGQRVTSESDFHDRFAGLTRVLSSNPHMFGYCYTQLTDVFQEQNGVYRFDRTEKLDIGRIRAVQMEKAAYEHGPAELAGGRATGE
ncbi:beta-galactosidase [Cryobacterium lactosi]|uniref:Beta-galactosidase n=1 Tax=Cryobacterium lactosi TaxID=1259202 RepID=A0A4R9C0Q6_9MICO|nr:sugar-binding domain-containing protein [Cryobacterium lactosi]TFD94119.1 beta-galactosidase [Cryobacterium lactosi]